MSEQREVGPGGSSGGFLAAHSASCRPHSATRFRPTCNNSRKRRPMHAAGDRQRGGQAPTHHARSSPAREDEWSERQ